MGVLRPPSVSLAIFLADICQTMPRGSVRACRPLRPGAPPAGTGAFKPRTSLEDVKSQKERHSHFAVKKEGRKQTL